MLPRKKRLSLGREFVRIRQKGKTYDSTSFGLVVNYGQDDGPKAAFIVSKKIDRRSVVRHAVKRKLAEVITPFFPRLKKNTELVFLAKQKVITVGKQELSLEIESILKRIRVAGS